MRANLIIFYDRRVRKHNWTLLAQCSAFDFIEEACRWRLCLIDSSEDWRLKPSSIQTVNAFSSLFHANWTDSRLLLLLFSCVSVLMFFFNVSKLKELISPLIALIQRDCVENDDVTKIVFSLPYIVQGRRTYRLFPLFFALIFIVLLQQKKVALSSYSCVHPTHI